MQLGCPQSGLWPHHDTGSVVPYSWHMNTQPRLASFLSAVPEGPGSRLSPSIGIHAVRQSGCTNLKRPGRLPGSDTPTSRPQPPRDCPRASCPAGCLAGPGRRPRRRGATPARAQLPRGVRLPAAPGNPATGRATPGLSRLAVWIPAARVAEQRHNEFPGWRIWYVYRPGRISWAPRREPVLNTRSAEDLRAAIRKILARNDRNDSEC